MFDLQAWQGKLTAQVTNRPDLVGPFALWVDSEPLGGQWVADPQHPVLSALGVGWNLQKSGTAKPSWFRSSLVVPQWFLILLSVTLAAAPWIRLNGGLTSAR